MKDPYVYEGTNVLINLANNKIGVNTFKIVSNKVTSNVTNKTEDKIIKLIN